MLIWFSLLLWGPLGVASPLQATRSIDELVRLEAKFSEQQRLRWKCEEEKRLKLFPNHCLQQLDQALSDPGQAAEVSISYRRLSRWCVRRSHLFAREAPVLQILRLVSLAPSCREALTRRLEDLRYQSGSWHPN